MSQIETDVAEWLINHKDGIEAELTDRSNHEHFPAFLMDIYEYYYPDAVVDFIKERVMDSFNLNCEEIELFFDKKFVKMCLGEKILQPIKK